MGALLDLLIQHNKNADLSDWAKNQYGQSNPQLASLAQADPESFRSILPTLMGKNLEQGAIADFYGQSKPPSVAASPGFQGPSTALAGQADQSGITWNQPPVAEQAQQASALKKIQAMAYLPSALQATAAQQMMFEGMGMGGSGSVGNSQVTGPDALNSLPPGISSQVKAMLEGRQAPPSQMALKTPYWQQMMQIANQVDPNFDQNLWQQRSKTVQDFNSTSGKSRQSITSIETALNHLSALQDANDKLGGWGMANKYLRNPVLSATSDPDLVAYNTIAKTAADEVSKATAGPGGSTQSDRENRLSSFTADQSPEARKTAITSAIELLNGRLEPMAESYNNAMGVAKRPTELLSPKAQSAYNKIMGIPSENVTASGNYNPAQDKPASALAKMSQPDLDAQAQEAIKRGADPAAVQARLQKLRQGQQ